MRPALFIVPLVIIAGTASARSDEVSIGGARPAVSKQDCQALVQYRQAPGVNYQPGVDIHGKYVAPADLPGGVPYTLPDKVQFDVVINPIRYAQRNALQSQLSVAQARLAASPGDLSAQEQISSLQSQISAMTGQFDNTQLPVGHVVVDLKSGEATLNGKPMEDSQIHYLEKVCREAGF